MIRRWLAVTILLFVVCSLRAQTNVPIISALAVLTIHVRDTNTHASVFHFLTNVLRLPVDYHPETHGERRYAAVYAGNMFIEPCGPFANLRYPVEDFDALFFGLNCVSEESPQFIASQLGQKKFTHERAGSDIFRVREDSLTEGIYLGIVGKVGNKEADSHDASLQSAMEMTAREGVGFAHVKEIWLGYNATNVLRKWGELLGTSNTLAANHWQLSKKQSFRFVKSEIPGVKAIVCKVRSLPRAEAWLRGLDMCGRTIDGRLEIKPASACGLQIYLTDQ